MKAPATYLGIQELYPSGETRLFNLTAQVGVHPIGSTVSEETLIEAGYEIPEDLRSERETVKG